MRTKPPCPGEVIASKLIHKDRNQSKLAKELGVTRQSLSMVMKGDRAISARLAVGLGKLSENVGFWLRVQELWSQWQAGPEAQQHEEAARLASHFADWDRGGSRLLVDSEIRTARAQKLLDISPFRDGEDGSLQRASYDLTIGSIYEVEDPSKRLPRTGTGDYELPPGVYFCGETAETVRLTSQVIGRLGQSSDLIEEGVVVTLGLQIDPSYEGPIFFGIENRWKNPVKVAADEVVVSVEFHFLANPSTRLGSEKAGDGGAFSLRKAP